MRRSLIAGATAVGLVLTVLVSPAAAAGAALPAPAVECDGTAASEAEAVALAGVCAEDVEVLGADGEDTGLVAEPHGTMRFEASALDPYVSTKATARTALNPASAADYGWSGTQWVGYCDPAEYAEGCDQAGVQRLVWQFDGMDVLRDLAPGDITSAELVLQGSNAWMDDVDCTPNRLDLYDIPRISAGTGWSSTAGWTQDRHAGQIAFYWPACTEKPAYTGYFDFDATQLAVNAVKGDRSSVTVGVRATDETCMTCGWNSFKPTATLIVRFNRPPLAPTDLGVGTQGFSYPCTGDQVLRTTTPYLTANIVDPDPDNGYPPDPAGEPVAATFLVARADEPDVPLWEGTESVARTGEHRVGVPSEILGAGRFIWTVFATDGGGLSGPSSSCTFSIDIEGPAVPQVEPLLGGGAVYLERTVRGGVGVPGSFLLTSSSDDVASYEYGINTQSRFYEVAAGKNTVLSVTPDRGGLNYLSVVAYDKAGNRSEETIFEFYVAFGPTAPTPPAITVSGPTSYTFGDVPTASVTLSEDAVTPYGTVTVRSGSATVGSATFDERTEELELDAAALGSGTKTLTFTYRAYPEAPAWSTQRTITIRPLAFSALRSPSISGTPQVGRTLTALRGPWTPSPSRTTYQWRVDGKAVSGATGSTWKVTSSAKGKKVSVAITGTKTGYTTKTLVSPASAAVKAGVFSTPTPKITGTPKVGAKLAVVRGTWTPQPTTVKYQWKVAGKVVKGATGSTFKVPSSAKGKRVSVVVTGSRAGYTTKALSKSMTTLIR
ncbi:hypothetical protein ACIGB8_18105 [Promicromonospora sukumoe]|uniref:hypothetical protein n=1 Tax=Promicromonospora sukumoe TaxID=88382 RepID=UPI0037C6C081